MLRRVMHHTPPRSTLCGYYTRPVTPSVGHPRASLSATRTTALGGVLAARAGSSTSLKVKRPTANTMAAKVPTPDATQPAPSAVSASPGDGKHQYASLFAAQADLYARFRPTYPAQLFERVFEFADSAAATGAAAAGGRAGGAIQHDVAVDLATGNGQAAIPLARRYAHVIGIDASPEQVKQAPPVDNIHFSLGTAEATGLADACADLVTVAQALHWFNLPQFYAEAARILRPHGVLAIWGYDNCTLGLPAADLLMKQVYGDDKL